VAGFTGWGIASGRRSSSRQRLAAEDMQRFTRPRLHSWRWDGGRLCKSGEEKALHMTRPLVQVAGFAVETKSDQAG
jgi:hypothetical protein